ncbi:hypothetical protein PIB30_079357 [Stylosanthes scabra]|uniref:Uncharacterized protein n=1 Tax=Stylosanthes scabra TaxID=79078 RepID=A0ABU6XTM2_9FABA|nr:hypothetical protein [Stylosanthes scabra]
MIRSKGSLPAKKHKIVLIWEHSVNNLVFLLVIQGNQRDHPIERLKGKINNLNLDPQIEEQINNLLIESSDDDSNHESSDDINNIQNDDIGSSSDSDEKEINVLTKDQDLLFEAIEAIGDPEQKKDFFSN